MTLFRFVSLSCQMTQHILGLMWFICYKSNNTISHPLHSDIQVYFETEKKTSPEIWKYMSFSSDVHDECTV